MIRRLRRAMLAVREGGLGPGSVDVDVLSRRRHDPDLLRFAAALDRVDAALGQGASAPMPARSAERRASILRAVRRERDRALEASTASGPSVALLWAGGGLAASAAIAAVWMLALRMPPQAQPAGRNPLATAPAGAAPPGRIAGRARTAASVIEDPLREEARRLARDGRRAAAMVLAAWRGAPSTALEPAPDPTPGR